MWKDGVGKSFPSHNKIRCGRWYSKYEVLEGISGKFLFLQTVVQEVICENLSKKNASRLVLLLTEERKTLQLQVELAAYKETLFELCNMCYYLKGDTTDLLLRIGF